MADIVVDSLITQLEYTADVKTIRLAESAVKDLEKQNKAAATATDTLTSAQIDLAEEIASETQKLNRLKDSQAALRREIKLSGRATKTQKLQLLSLDTQIVSASRHTRDLRMEQAQLGRQKARVARGAKDLAQEQRRLAVATRQATQRMREQKVAAKNLATEQANARDKAKSLALGAAAIVGAVGTGIFAVGREVVETGATFEGLRARLKTVEGSADGANRAFARIQDFAKKTPFQVEGLTDAFTQLRVRGVQPSTETLTALGDLASAFGQDFTEVTDAIGSAARGELDPIEKFGISAKIAGDKIKLSFKGQTAEVDRNATAVTDALVAFGKMEGVQGAMADQSKTLGGQFSNLQDNLSSFLDLTANLGVLDEVRLIAAELGATLDGDLAQIIADVLVGALETLRGIIVTIKGDGDGVSTTFKSVVEILELLANIVKVVFIAFFPFSLFFKQLAPLLLRVFNLIGMLAEGINDLLDIALDLVKKLLQPIGDLFDLIVEFVELLGVWVDDWLGLTEAWERAAQTADGILGSITGLTFALNEQADATNAAREALVKLDKEEAKRQQKQIQEKALAATAKVAQGGGVSKARQDQAKKRAEQVVKRLDLLDDTQLAGFINDPLTPPKIRDKAEKEQIRRDKKKAKGSKKKPRQDLLTAQITKEIDEASKKAGQRAASRAVLRGEKDTARINQIQKDAEKDVRQRLTTRFQETGELPPGLATDLTQLANLPNVQDITGKVAPPVITVNNFKTDVTVESIQANVTVEGGLNGTPQAVANAAAGQIRVITQQDLGRAIQNGLTNLR